MVRGMEADEIDAPPVSIVSVELGRVLVRERAELEKLGRPRAGPKRFKPVHRPRGAFALNRLPQRDVGIVEVGVDEFDRLVEDLVGHGPIRVEDATKIVLSVGKGVHGAPSPFCTRLLLMAALGKKRSSPVAVGWTHVNRRPCPPTRSTVD